jgi:quercetin dioxygenase-like cupin family protein
MLTNRFPLLLQKLNITAMTSSDGGKVHVEKWDSEKDGPLTETAMRHKLTSQGYSCSTYTFRAGEAWPDHTHDISKKDAVVSGRLMVRMYGEKVILQPGDVVDVPRDTVHSAAVEGIEPVLFIDSTK